MLIVALLKGLLGSGGGKKLAYLRLEFIAVEWVIKMVRHRSRRIMHKQLWAEEAPPQKRQTRESKFIGVLPLVFGRQRSETTRTIRGSVLPVRRQFRS